MTDDIQRLLTESVEKIADGWITELKAIRENTQTLETQLISCVAKTKDNIKRLHELGAQVADEAKRGREVCARLSEGIAQINGDAVADDAVADEAAE